MPLLPNSRHERFAQELAKGKCAVEAYGIAGYQAAHRQNAARLMTNDAVMGRLLELQEAAARRTEVTIERLLDEAEEARLLALATKQPTAMVAATMLKAKLTGKLVKRLEVGEPNEFDNMTEEQLRQFIKESEKLLTGSK